MAAAFWIGLALWASAMAQTPPVANRVVVVNVVVHDANGPVAELKSGDLRVLDGGTHRKPAFFLRDRAVEKQPRLKLPDGWFSNRPEYFSDTPGSATVVLLDALNTRFPDNPGTHRKMVEFLAHVAPGVAVYTLAPDLKVVSDYSAPVPQTGDLITALTQASESPATEMKARTAAALVAIADHLGHVAGRRNLVWVSTSFPVTFSPEDPALAVALSDLAIYPVDARALGGTSRVTSKDEMRPIDPRDLARRTGGLAFLDSRSVPNAIRDVLADSRVNYTLGFVAGPETFDGKFHELRVQATRPGLQVRHRDGWFAGAGNSEPLPRNRLHELLARPLDSTRVSVIARPDRERSLRVALSFNPANLGFAPGGKGMNGAIDVYCQQQDVEGRPLGSGTVASLSMSFTPEDYRKALQEGIRHTLDLEPQPGVARLRIVAHDRSTGRAGSLAIALTPLPGHDLSALPTFRAETKLALVRFRLAPKRGRLVTDLGPDDIEIREDGVVQKTSLFEGGRLYPLKSPLEISLLFDCSGSVQQAGTLDPHVFQTSLLNEYENISIGIFGFADTFVRLTSPTRDPVALQRAMNAVATVPTGGTPLFEHIANTIRDIASTPTTASRMLLIFSDGESTRPGDDGRVSEAVAAALESGVTLNPVMLLRPMGGSQLPSAQQRAPSPADPTAQPVPPSMQVETSVASFMRLAKDTGGQKFEVLLANQDVLPKILRELAARVRYEYVVGYYPQSGAGRKRRKVEVVLKRKDRGDLIGGYRTVVQ